jgi:L-iditol 2-dehydrogenase
MKSLVYTAPQHLELQDLPVPVIKPDEVLVRVRAVGVCGSDLHGFLGKSKKRIPPLVLGHEFCGEVAEVGDRVSGFDTGDTVAVYPLISCGQCRFCKRWQENICPNRKVYGLDFHGGLAEYVAAPEHCLFKLPANLSFLEGSLVEPLANAVHVVERCGNVDGKSGVVIGAGPIGLLSHWVARHQGAKKLAIIDINPHRLETAMDFGADLVVDASKEEPVRAVLNWTLDQGSDFTVDAVGNSVCRRNSVTCTANGGTAVWIGLDEDLCEIDARLVVTRELQIRGTYAYTKADFAQAISLLQGKKLAYKVLTHPVTLTDGQTIFDDLATGFSSITKAVFML